MPLAELGAEIVSVIHSYTGGGMERSPVFQDGMDGVKVAKRKKKEKKERRTGKNEKRGRGELGIIGVSEREKKAWESGVMVRVLLLSLTISAGDGESFGSWR